MMIYRTLLFVSVIVLSFAQPLQAADNPKPEKPSYSLRQVYEYNFERHYTFTEKTQVERRYSDNSVKEFTREVTYFLTQRCDTINEDKSAVVSVNVDSMQYRFGEGSSEVFYDSQIDKGNSPKLKFADLSIYSAPLNRTFQVHLTPYGDFADVSGEQIDWLKNYIAENGRHADTLTKFTWLDAISFNNLRHIGDIHKGILTGTQMRSDSVWLRQMNFRAEGVDFFADSVSAKIDDYVEGRIYVSARAPMAAAKTGSGRFYNINEIGNVLSGKGNADLTLTLNAVGVVSDVSLKFSGNIAVRVGKENFTEKISTESSWKLTGQNPI